MLDCCTAFCDSFVLKDREMFVKNLKRIRNRDREPCRRCKKIVKLIDANDKEGARELIEITLASEKRKYIREHFEKKVNEKMIFCKEAIICMGCKQKREYYSKGLCRKCYNKIRYKINTGCIDCGKGKHYAMGYCVTCYARHSKRERGKKKNGE